ncbi:MAG: methylated-DNA--[protein]-cysteine S-methyltransferase [Cryomorphaceae bacterium]|nr:methylated-DNA--[protein]-cysteine S-methyltransferase [Cryomorphaceae bacterium]
MSYNYIHYESPVGRMILASHEGELVMTDWYYRKQRDLIDKRVSAFLNADPILQSDSLLMETERQLTAYFKGRLKIFDLPIKYCGSEFQQRVWIKLNEIPFGELNTYKQLALELGSLKSIRAIAAANGANSLSLLVPCHRVVGSNGSLVGYAGGLEAKRKLLALERGGFGDLFGTV